jgi:hypothetical protein
LGYLLIQSNGGTTGAKERFLSEFLEYINVHWNLRVIITLTDKDWAEINAFLAKFPEAKHQLCFWHALRAIKRRLSFLRRAPAFYNVTLAVAEFDWIDPSFVPVSQCAIEDRVSCHLYVMHVSNMIDLHFTSRTNIPMLLPKQFHV